MVVKKRGKNKNLEKQVNRVYSKKRRVSENGKIYYYTYVKKKPTLKNERKRINFKIISTNRGKEAEVFGTYNTIEEASLVLEQLIQKNKDVIFPREWNNSTKELIKCDYEFLLLKVNRGVNSNEKIITKLPNEFGKITNHIVSNSEKWYIIDKKPYTIEETFWVYNHHPKFDRKDFTWCLDNLIVNKISGSKYDEKLILLYKNKIFIQHSPKKFDMVICKNKSDGIRFYNLLNEKCKKYKQVIFLGHLKNSGEFRKNIINLIMSVTGWNYNKVNRQSTRT